MDEKKQVKILLSVLLLGAALFIVYAAFFASPVKIYEVHANGSLQEGSGENGARIEVPEGAEGASGSKKSEAVFTEKININTASFHELLLLPGVGEKTADEIIAYREENGDFSSVEDLQSVQGIGEKKMEALRERVTVN